MTSAQELQAHARTSFEQGDLGTARADYEHLLALQPDSAEVLNDLGTVCFAMGLQDASVSYYARALQVDGANAEAMANLKMACQARGLPWQGVLDELQGTGAPDEPGSLVCPCCGGRFTTFAPAGGKRKLPNRKCPQCGSLERHRALWLFMAARTDLLTAGLRVLHFAPMASLRDPLAAMPNLHYITADLDPRKADVAMDITDILFRDGAFDAVLCIHVLEHIDDDRRAMREIHRVLKPGGWAIVHSPVDANRYETLEDPAVTSPEERERLFGQSDHVRAYGRDFYDRLSEAGFDVTVDDYLRQLGPAMAERHRLRNETVFPMCRKRQRPTLGAARAPRRRGGCSS